MMSNNPSTVAEYYADFIAEKEAPAVFQLSGGMIAFLADAIYRKGVTPLITNRHEQASGFAAEGGTRVSGKTCVALGTSGPGASNLVTAIASCYFDSVPVVFITGQVNTEEIKSSKGQRQNGFQELDVVTMVKGITKATYSPRTAEDAIQALHEAWKIANQPRFGPVLIDLPIDIQQLPVKELKPVFPKAAIEKLPELEDDVFSQVNSAIQNSRKPLILVGGGVVLDHASRELEKFVAKTQIPVVATLMGLDSAAKIGTLNLGFIGSYGNRWANAALKDSDLLIVLGCRLDPRQTGASIEEFKKGKIIVRVDIDNFELEGRVEADIKINSTIGQFLSDSRLNKEEKISNPLKNQSQSIRISKPQTDEQEIELSLNPNEFLAKISLMHRDADGYIVDVGQHQMWAAQSINLFPNQRFLTSGGLGAMGFSLPAAIGASIATKGEWVVVLGDGCAQLSAPELQTISELNLPIVIYVMNNRQHGMVAQFQDENMKSRYVGTRFGYSAPDFCTLAETYGFRNTFTINSINQLEFRSNSKAAGPVLVNVIISRGAKALPKMTS
ncbi:IlvB Thiamine pyrophosphate-requiring enzymes [acetolactate synthase, pyruvate dehydrogenase (cytochrome), glyoxylate carboligase, phosphonopyruvate decarboxylase] [Candidatus Nanopelagicaceae bacterium]